ncbi:MAG: winged helix-turn-helix domain-containing protein [Pseudomonadota bacterium]
MKYQFGNCEFDTALFELRCGGVPVIASHKVLSILSFLLVSRSRLVSKDELVEEIWDGRAVTDAAIAVRISELRRAIGDNGKNQTLVRTVRGQGFRFVASVTVESDAMLVTEKQSLIPELSKPIVPFPTQPSVAILKAKMNGVQGEYGFLARALPDEIITALSRMRSLMVKARGSTFQHTSYEQSPRASGALLDADYIFSCELGVSDGRVCISCELSRAKTDEAIWRTQLSVKLNEVHELREDIVRDIATRIDHNIARAELRKARLRVPEELGVWHNYHLGISRLEALGRPDFDGATVYLETAVEQDPFFARGHAELANAHLQRFFWSWKSGMKLHSQIGRAEAKKAYELDPSDPICALMASRERFYVGDHEVAESLLRKSVRLSPSQHWAQADLARLMVQKGDPDGAVQHLNIAHALHPAWLNPTYLYGTSALIGILKGDLDHAVEKAQQMEGMDAPGLYGVLITLTAYHLAQMPVEANRVATIIKERFQGMTGPKLVASNSSWHPDLSARFEDAMAANGIG